MSINSKCCVQDVRKMVILSIPLINSTIPQIFEHTMDVSDSVRRAAYSVLGSKLPINMLRSNAFSSFMILLAVSKVMIFRISCIQKRGFNHQEFIIETSWHELSMFAASCKERRSSNEVWLIAYQQFKLNV
jgi:hypothetical protein